MKAAERAAKRLASTNGITREQSICLSCRIGQRRNASTATAEAPSEPPAQQIQSHPVTQTGPQKAYKLLTAPILSRPPLLTRDLTSFEKSFYLYQKRLNERLALPFTRYFYFKKGTPADEEWKRKARSRKGTAARDIGIYNAYDSEGWNDEVLVGSDLGEPENVVENLSRDMEGKDIVSAKSVGDEEVNKEAIGGDPRLGEGSKKELERQVERPMPRQTEADRTNDRKSLNRKLDRTLYLLVKRADGQWRFPEDRVYGRENLREAAQRTVLSALGPNLHHWLVGNHPVAHFSLGFTQPSIAKVPAHPQVPHSSDLELEEFGEKIFFMKGRVMAGQVDLKNNEYGDQEWAWLAKEEVQEVVQENYWKGVRHALVTR